MFQFRGLVVIFYWLSHLYTFLIDNESYEPNDENCLLAGQGLGMIGSEDLALGKYGVLFITSGDLHTTIKEGPLAANPGGIWVMDMRMNGSKRPRRIEIPNFPTDRRFQPHGFDVSNATDRVLAISHNGDHSSVDIFQIGYNPGCLASLPWSCEAPVTLSYIRSVTSDIFPNYGINDVVEAEKNQFYVTQWLPFGLPVDGENNPTSLWESLTTKLALPLALLNIKLTTVIHCIWDGKTVPAKCKYASGDKFIYANGITISPDGLKVFVSDPPAKKITAMDRNKTTGMLTRAEVINLPFMADNIEYDDEADEILVGTMTDLGAVIKKSGGQDVAVAGGLAVVSRVVDGQGWEVNNLIQHDGTKLSQISAGARLGGRVVIGSPFSEGVLVCDN